MRTDRDYYRILGIERSATQDQIKKRYRELVRQHHPDANPNQHAGLGHNAFLQIVEAYQILSDSATRREYDRIWERRTPASDGPRPAGAGRPGAAATAGEPPAGSAVVANLVGEARRYFEARNYSETTRTCQRVLQLDRENPAAYELMGDVRSAQKRIEEAISYYTMAQQFSRSPGPEIQSKIDRLMKREEKIVHEAIHGKPIYKRAPAMVILIGCLVIIGTWGLSLSGGPTLDSFAFLDQTPGRTFLMLMAASLCLGGVMAGSGHLERFDDELLFDLGTQRVAGGTPPIGLMLPVLSVLSFYLAVVCYILYAAMHDRFSASVLKAAAAVWVLTLIFALPHANAVGQMLIFGAGPAFAIMCVGWLLADVIRPHW